MAVDWTALAEGDIAIAHLSDLHFGSHDYERVWKLVAQCLRERVKPSLLLVTGDLADSPHDPFYKAVHTELENLGIPYFVCPGNHDRFLKGTRISLEPFLTGFVFWSVFALLAAVWIFATLVMNWYWFVPVGPALGLMARWLVLRLHHVGGLGKAGTGFDNVFTGRVVSHVKAEEVPLGQENNRWKIGLMGVDSSYDADSAARGYVPEDRFQEITQRTRRKDWDLCIFLVHHHVLSVRNLEARRWTNRADLFNLTCMVNSGSLLETLADGHVDLVLHGHEHAHNWASYGSFSSGCVQVRVVGAGSATGNDSLAGCDVNRATFNVVILSPNRSGVLRRMSFQANDWKVDDEVPLFGSSELRCSRAHREKRNPRDEIRSEITKFVEITRERDIWINWLFTNWLPAVHYEQEVYNSSGSLDSRDLKVRLVGHGLGPAEPADARFEKSGDHKWKIKWTVPASHRGVPVNVEIRFRWRGGAALTAAELQRIKDAPAPGEFREEGLDFATIWTPAPVVSAEIFLLLPPEYAPEHIRVKVRDADGNDCAYEATELTHRLRTLAQGCFAFQIPFPRLNHMYYLVWEPVPKEGHGVDWDADSDFRVFCEAAQNRGQELLRSFCAALAKSSLADQISLALYLKADNPMTAKRVAFYAPGNPHLVKSSEFIPIHGDKTPMGQAWWGVPSIVPTRPGGGEAGLMGFVDGEKSLIHVPIRFGFEWINPPPWGVVRIGILDKADTAFLQNQEKIWNLLFLATMNMLRKALSVTPN
jgi:3',5'-cyclic AMP phosphodiesterase CpdA